MPCLLVTSLVSSYQPQHDGNAAAPAGFAAKEPDATMCKSYVEKNYGFVAHSDASWRSRANAYSSYGYVVFLFGVLAGDWFFGYMT